MTLGSIGVIAVIPGKNFGFIKHEDTGVIQ